MKNLYFLVLIVIVTSAFANASTRRNGKIAFVSDRDGNPEIYVMNSDGSDQVRLTNNTTTDDHPKWSPDGKSLAYVCGESICLMKGDGTNMVKLAFPNRFRFSPTDGLSWSPDGGSLALIGGFLDPTGQLHDGGIKVFKISDGSIINVTSTDGGERQPSWSPDGSKILFSRYMYSSPYWGSIMHTVDIDGSGLRQLPNGFFTDGWDDIDAKWSPSGDKIVFSENVWDFHWDIYIANADGTNRRFIDGCGRSVGPCDDRYLDWFNPSWSPDGTHIILHVADRFWTDIQVFDKNIEDASLRQLTKKPGNNFNASWQPLPSEVTVTGRILTSDGAGIRNAIVFLNDAHGDRRSAITSTFGYYSFDNVPAGEQYMISVSSRRYRFDPLIVQVEDHLSNADLVAIK